MRKYSFISDFVTMSDLITFRSSLYSTFDSLDTSSIVSTKALVSASPSLSLSIMYNSIVLDIILIYHMANKFTTPFKITS